MLHSKLEASLGYSEIVVPPPPTKKIQKERTCKQGNVSFFLCAPLSNERSRVVAVRSSPHIRSCRLLSAGRIGPHTLRVSQMLLWTPEAGLPLLRLPIFMLRASEHLHLPLFPHMPSSPGVVCVPCSRKSPHSGCYCGLCGQLLGQLLVIPTPLSF